MKRMMLVTLFLVATLGAWLAGPTSVQAGWMGSSDDNAAPVTAPAPPSTEAPANLASQTETDAAALAGQSEQDAANLAVTADDINTRIDNSEATTLRLSDDIGVMADRIGEMADRILWTELQIGVMADRIVESEYLINAGAQQSADQIQESQGMMLTDGMQLR